jgi:putative tricarboxylic transport membrane protein
MYPAILVFAVVGVYAVNESVVDVWIMAATGLLGYLLRKFDFETAPVVLGLVLAPMLEMSLRQSLALSGGSYWIFVTRPISATMLGIGLLLLLLNLRPVLTRRRGDWRQKVGLGEVLSEEKEGNP